MEVTLFLCYGSDLEEIHKGKFSTVDLRVLIVNGDSTGIPRGVYDAELFIHISKLIGRFVYVIDKFSNSSGKEGYHAKLDCVCMFGPSVMWLYVYSCVQESVSVYVSMK
ncbi:hypothetical protein L1887_34411 [Cichorium endivia]|nr:hypothetical protein L1887_34411 [Cichorium endivia]